MRLIKKAKDTMLWRVMLSSHKNKFRTVFSEDAGIVANVYGRSHIERDTRVRMVTISPDLLKVANILQETNPEILNQVNPNLIKELQYINKQINKLNAMYDAIPEKIKIRISGDDSGENTQGS